MKNFVSLSIVGWLAAAAAMTAGPGAARDVDTPAVLGVEPIGDALPFYDPARHTVRYPGGGDERPTLGVLLSRERYWDVDGHLDVVVQLDTEAVGSGDALRVRILDAAGTVQAERELAPLPAPRLVFYPAIPGALSGGGSGILETAWIRDGAVQAEVRQGFRVERWPAPAPRTGRVPVRIANAEEVQARQVPFTVGVPFPRGALDDAARLRLVDEAGREVPLQVLETGRWSRYGSVKWVLCDFTLDLHGGPRELRLEYGPDTVRTGEPAIEPVLRDGGFPVVEAGRLRLDGGLWFDAQGTGEFVRVLGEEALAGAFVVREDGRRYVPGVEDRYDIEEQGPRKVVIRREGWYEGAEPGDRFCLYITRYVLHLDSPLLRIFHTWIFTGDGNRERIANMGWSFPLAGGIEGRGFLRDWDEDGWLDGMSLLQYDYAHLDVADGEGAVREIEDGRAPGVARAEGAGVRLLFGARDFWQNYPSELEFADGALWFHNWPRRNRPAAYTFAGEHLMERGEAALPTRARHAQVQEGRLTRSEWKLNVLQARFAHEGELLDFRLPDELAEDPIWIRSSLNRSNINWHKGRPETANAQGISRTEEMWIHLSAADSEPAGGLRLLRGLNRETLRAVADPAWVAASGAFYAIHPRDTENYPEDERVFDLIARFPGRMIEHLGLYGMWIYGDIAAWSPNMVRREPALYRAFRKGHHGWPYSWVPFARSGDPELLRLADAATRQNIDANYCHYYTDEIDAQSGEHRFRRRGRWQRSTLPWASRRGPTSRCYESQCDFLWHAWYLTGYHRAREHIDAWAAETKQEEDLFARGPIAIQATNRYSLALLKSYLDMYEATFDPWFLVAAHAIAEGHLAHHRTRSWSVHGAGDNVSGASHFWRTGDRDYLEFTGREDYRDFYLDYADFWGRHQGRPYWAMAGAPVIEPTVHAWRLTGRDYYLRRAASILDRARVSVFDADEPPYLLGDVPSIGMTRYHGWYLSLFPLALAAFEDAGRRPAPLSGSFFLNMIRLDSPEGNVRYRTPPVWVRKKGGAPLPLSFSAVPIPTREEEGETLDYRVTGPGDAPVLAGSWRLRDRCELVIPAEAPAGVYRIEVEGAANRGGLEIPVALAGTPEVVAWEPGRPAQPHTSHREVQFWFRVPEGLASFLVDFPAPGSRMQRISIWTPDGERAWNLQAGHREMAEPVRAEIAVDPGQDGRLWRITLPGGGAFTLDPRIPPVLSVDAETWFLPE